MIAVFAANSGLLGAKEMRAVSLAHAVGEARVTAISEFALLAELQDYDFPDVQLCDGIEGDPAFAEIGADGLIGSFHQQAAAEYAQGNFQRDALALTAVKRGRQLRADISALGV